MNAYHVRPFADSLALGRHAEAAAREMLEGRGWQTWDTAAHEGETLRAGPWSLKLAPPARGRGPRWALASGLWLAADIFAWNGERAICVEVKRKLQGAQWNRTHGQWVTGCDRSKFEGYIRAEQRLGIQHTMLFYHARRPDDPVGGRAPSGWHAATISQLRNCGGPPCQETRLGMPRLEYFWLHGLRSM